MLNHPSQAEQPRRGRKARRLPGHRRGEDPGCNAEGFTGLEARLRR